MTFNSEVVFLALIAITAVFELKPALSTCRIEQLQDDIPD